jgi:hypothetical protein
MTTSIPGASVWEQDLYWALARHVATEHDILDEYRVLAAAEPTTFVTYLARMILSDEERHHQLFNDLAETVKAFAEFRYQDEPIPSIPHKLPDAAGVVEQAERFLTIERDDLAELRHLKKRLKEVKDTTLWDLVISLMEMDTEKHIKILEFVRTHARG